MSFWRWLTEVKKPPSIEEQKILFCLAKLSVGDEVRFNWFYGYYRARSTVRENKPAENKICLLHRVDYNENGKLITKREWEWMGYAIPVNKYNTKEEKYNHWAFKNFLTLNKQLIEDRHLLDGFEPLPFNK